jgi:hypothetical protein
MYGNQDFTLFFTNLYNFEKKLSLMRQKLPVYLLFSLFLALLPCIQGCKTGEGCGLEEKYGAPVDKNGELSSKRGKSGLFSKKQQKRMKKGK